MKRFVVAGVLLVAVSAALAAGQAPKPDPSKFLTQPLVKDLYAADPHFIMSATGTSPYGPFTVRGRGPRASAGLDEPPLDCRVQGQVIPLLPRCRALGRPDAPSQLKKVTELQYRADESIVTVDAYIE